MSHMNRLDIDIMAARIAGYHDDQDLFTRLVVESRARLDEAWREGRRRRESGMPCDCYSCEEERVRHERHQARQRRHRHPREGAELSSGADA